MHAFRIGLNDTESAKTAKQLLRTSDKKYWLSKIHFYLTTQLLIELCRLTNNVTDSDDSAVSWCLHELSMLRTFYVI